MELVVVIAIIGILMAILIPSLLHYIRKAQRKADIETARLIGQQVMVILTEYPELQNSVYSRGGGRAVYQVTCGGERYEIESIARCDGTDDNKDTQTYIGKNRSQGAWDWTADIYEPFREKLNAENSLIMGGQGKQYIPMRSRYYEPPKSECNNETDKVRDPSERPGYSRTDRWLIVHRTNEPGKRGRIEVWAGNSQGRGANGPRVRLWPDPPSYY